MLTSSSLRWPSARLVYKIIALAAVFVVALTVAAPSPADAARAKKRESGRVKAVADGDTPYLNRKTRGGLIRLAGIQAMETTHGGRGANQCHGPEAKKRLARLTVGKKVQMRSQRKLRVEDGRRLRYMYVKKKKRWVDVQEILLREGHVLWHPTKEWVNSKRYHELADQAAAKRKRGTIWDDDWCGKGPYQGAALQTWVNWDADGNDNQNINGEYVVIANNSSYAVPLRGWALRDSSHDTYRFRAGTVLPAGGRIKLHVGRGSDTATDLYWGHTKAIFPNGSWAKGAGEGVYLLDPQGDFRSWFTYPCVTACGDPARGRLSISKVRYDPDGYDTAAGEYVQLRLASGAPRTYLEKYMLRDSSQAYRFPAGSYLDAGETLTVNVGRASGSDRADRLHHYWGKSAPILSNAGERVEVVDYRAGRLACESWGSGRC